eukprot:scaffold82785_cov30-Tisochrysis_lutea.AAC.5
MRRCAAARLAALTLSTIDPFSYSSAHLSGVMPNSDAIGSSGGMGRACTEPASGSFPLQVTPELCAETMGGAALFIASLHMGLADATPLRLCE